MPYLPSTTSTATLPPEEEAVAPVESAPVAATEEEAIYGASAPAQATTPVTEEEAIYGTTTAPADDVAPGPFTNAVQGVQEGLGQAVAPLQEALPEPVRNLTDIVGQPVGGALDAVTGVTTALGQGDLPGAAGEVLNVAGQPSQRVLEQTGQRIAEGDPALPSAGEILADPGDALATLGGAWFGEFIPRLYGEPSPDEWAQANPERVRELAAAGGGPAVISGYLDDSILNTSDVPPPQWVNPFDAWYEGDGNILQRAGNVLGDIPETFGGVGGSIKEGTFGPFIRSQLIYAGADPLIFVPGAVGSRVTSGVKGAVGRGVRRVPGGARLLERAPSEVARLEAEQIGTAAGELLPAMRAAEASGAVPAAVPTPGAVPTPTPNGRLAPPPDLGQAVAAAPPIPRPDAARVGELFDLGEDLVPEVAAGRMTPAAAADIVLARRSVGFPQYEHVRLAPNAPLRPRSPLTNRPIIPPGSRPEIEGPLRAQLDGMGLRDVGVTLVNDLRDAAPDARPTEQARYLPESNTIALSLDTTSPADWPALIEREAQRAVREQTQRQTAQAAYGNAPLEARAAVATVPSPTITRHNVVVSDAAARDLAQSADGKFRFADGYRPNRSLTTEEVFNQTLNDAHYWANADDITNRRWLELDKRFNPEGREGLRESLRGAATDTAARDRIDAHAFAVYEDALQRALPRNAPKGRLGRLNQQYLSTVRRVMLFNPLRLPSYVMQNLITNSINLGARIGPRAVVDMWTKPSEVARVFRNARSLGEGKPVYHTTFGSMQAKMKVGTKPNIPMSHTAYFDRLGGKTPKWLDRVQRALAPNTSRYMGTMADQLPREVAGTRVIQREYRKLNREMPAKIRKELYDRGVFVPEAKAYQVWRDFADAERTITDLNTGAPIRTMLGAREAKFEPVWAADDFGKYLKEHLTEDMRDPPDAAALDRAIDRIVRDSKNRHRAILDTAEREVDAALFDWRNTNADEMAGKLFLYHFWASRQGGLYVTEALKRPYMISAYGRMMDEFEQQAEELEQPPWMKGFFQLQNSVAGYSTWFSPFDLVQSLLTFADWQYGQEDSEYKDLTLLGKGAGMAPFLIHPALQMVAYSLGLLGPDYYAPTLTGAETYGAKAIDLLNLANAQGKLPAWVNAMGIGVDANGNKVPVPVRPLQELYARVGNAISTAFAPVTGLSPVEVANMGGSWERNIASIAEAEYRKAHPEADQMEVNRAVTDIIADHGSPEYQAAFRKAADMPFALSEGMPGVVSAAARIASPVRVYNWPEQYNLDRWNLTPSGDVPPRNIPHFGEIDPATGELTPAGERAKFVHNAAKYGATATPEARHLANLQNEFYALEPLDYAEADAIAGKLYAIHEGTVDETVTVGGVEYTPDMIQAMERGDLYDLGTQALADAGYSREDQQGFKDAQAQYLADNPELAGYFEYKDLVRNHPGGEQGFVTETALTNPGFAQFVRSSLMDHTTGEIDYGAATYVDAYLASQGTRPSVYSPLVGNEPSMVPGGYPSLAGVEPGQPLLPQVQGTEPFPLYSKPVDPESYFANESLVAWIDPQLAGQMQTVGGADSRYGMVQVSVGGQVGYVDPAYLANVSPPQPALPPGPAPASVQPTGGLAGLAGGVMSTLGGAKDAIQGALGGSAGPGMAPAAPAPSGMSTTPSGPFTIDTTTYAGTPNRSDRTAPPEGIVYHYTAGGSIDEFIADFMGQTGRDASSNYVVDKDGTIYELIDPDQAAWTHGDTSSPRTDLPWLAEQIAAGYNMNDRAIGIEIVNEGNRDGEFVPYTPEQIAAVTWLTQQLVDRYGITPSRDRLLGHSDINTTGKVDPGPLFPLDDIIAAAA